MKSLAADKYAVQGESYSQNIFLQIRNSDAEVCAAVLRPK